MLLAIASALANPTFNGTWVLDKGSSESMAPILEAQGLSWIERTLAETGTPEHTITWRADGAEVDVRSGWYTRRDSMVFDGVERTVSYLRIGDVAVRSDMRDGAIYTRGELTMRDGSPGVLEATRRLADPDTLVLDMVFTFSDGRSVSAERVFRRTES